MTTFGQPGPGWDHNENKHEACPLADRKKVSPSRNWWGRQQQESTRIYSELLTISTTEHKVSPQPTNNNYDKHIANTRMHTKYRHCTLYKVHIVIMHMKILKQNIVSFVTVWMREWMSELKNKRKNECMWNISQMQQMNFHNNINRRHKKKINCITKLFN